jgi:hypothetical protein
MAQEKHNTASLRHEHSRYLSVANLHGKRMQGAGHGVLHSAQLNILPALFAYELIGKYFMQGEL